jgi:predicted F0F1-ATPase subunit
VPQDGDKTEDKHTASFWQLVARVSSLGWSLALPIAGGVLLGNYLDRITGNDYMWTLTLLFLGVALAFYNLYHILFKESNG